MLVQSKNALSSASPQLTASENVPTVSSELIMAHVSSSPRGDKLCDAATLDPWAVDPYRAMIRSVAVGFWVPLSTIPLSQIEANIIINKGFKVAWEMTVKNPLKGYWLASFTNTARTALLFNSTPWAKEKLEAYGYSPMASKMLAFGFAGALEGSVMSPRFLLMHKLHTTKAATCREVYNGIARREWWASLGITCRYSVVRDMTFWSIYAGTVDRVERQLQINRQPESLAKYWEEFFIGAGAGLIASPFSFPVHAALRRRLDGDNLSVTMKQDILKAWKEHGWKFISQHVYRGFLSSAIILPVSMGMMNLAKHGGDHVYERFASQGFFKPKAKAMMPGNALLPVDKERQEEARMCWTVLGMNSA